MNENEIIVDSFAGGGGASLGIAWAICGGTCLAVWRLVATDIWGLG